MGAADPVAILSTFELEQLVYHTISFLNVPVGALDRDDSAIAASFALRKVESYLRAVRQAENRRRDLGLQVGEELAEAETHRADNTDEADRLRQEALRLTGDYEIQQHVFALCASQINRLIALVNRIVGVTMLVADKAYLDSYQPLRNQFEHLDERLPGEERGGRLVLDVPSRMLLGLRDDGAGNISVERDGVDIVAAVNIGGVEEIEAIVDRSFADIRAKCIEYLEQFFADHPELTRDTRWLQPMVRQRLREDNGDYV